MKRVASGALARLVLPTLFGWILVVGAATLVASVRAHADVSDPAARCSKVRNDDAIQGYDPALKAKFIAAFSRLFPGAERPVEERLMVAQAKSRCMDGVLYACFVGANLPCSKMDAKRRNRGASAFCKTNRESSVVPLVATGHDTIFSYRCRRGQALVDGETYRLDRRGFATKLWTPLR